MPKASSQMIYKASFSWPFSLYEYSISFGFSWSFGLFFLLSPARHTSGSDLQEVERAREALPQLSPKQLGPWSACTSDPPSAVMQSHPTSATHGHNCLKAIDQPSAHTVDPKPAAKPMKNLRIPKEMPYDSIRNELFHAVSSVEDAP